jgi:hypothetical protein
MTAWRQRSPLFQTPRFGLPGLVFLSGMRRLRRWVRLGHVEPGAIQSGAIMR